MAGYGPTPKLNDKVADQICSLVRAGAFLETAAASVGLPSRTIRIWMRRGREDLKNAHPKTRYAKFATKMIQASADFELSAEQLMSVAAHTDWRAAAELLKCRFPSRWNPSVRVTLESELDRLEKTLERTLSADDVRRVMEALVEEDRA